MTSIAMVTYYRQGILKRLPHPHTRSESERLKPTIRISKTSLYPLRFAAAMNKRMRLR